MNELGVPEEVQAKLMGENARRLYGIEGKVFVSEEAPPIERPDWFPQGPEFEEWTRLVVDPRKNAEKLKKYESPLAAMARRGAAAGAANT
jgi:hypothetical protein